MMAKPHFTVDRIDGKRWHEKFAQDGRLKTLGHEANLPKQAPNFTLLAYKDNHMIGFVECHVTGPSDLVWQFGGAFLDCQNSRAAVFAAISLMDYSHQYYDKIHTWVGTAFPSTIKLLKALGFQVVDKETHSVGTHFKLECKKPAVILPFRQKSVQLTSKNLP